jgi:hypothetical protein
MATIDHGLLPLIEVLAGTDADWIAFEMIEELRAGRVPEETAEDLQNVQLFVRSKKSEKRRSEELATPSPAAERITGAEQIDWAADYVNKRVSDVVAMLDATFSQLDKILFAELSPESRDPISAPPTIGITLVVQGDEEEQASVHRENAAIAQTMLPTLRDALVNWADSVRP